MPMLAAFVIPHPPALPTEMLSPGVQSMAQTIVMLEIVAQRVRMLAPDVIVLASPHATPFADYFHISPGTQAKGGFGALWSAGNTLSVQYDAELVSGLEKTAREWGCPPGSSASGMPAGSRRVGAALGVAAVRHSVQGGAHRSSGLSALTHYQMGQCIAFCGANSKSARGVHCQRRSFAVKLSPESPYEHSHRRGANFDRM